MKLFNDDCFNVFPQLEDNSINLFILDLPYNITGCKWDKEVIPLDKMWENIKKVMKPDGIVVMFCTTKFGYTLINSNPKWFRYDLIWKKSRKVGFLNSNKMPLRQHENIYLFKPEQGTYHPQKTEGKEIKMKRKNTSQRNVYGNINLPEGSIYKDRHPTSIIDYEGDTILEYKNPHKTIHKTQKPVELCEWLIKTYSNEGDTVMDFTMGSGTTGIACLNTKRKFIGVEKDEEIFKLAEERIKNHSDSDENV